MLKDATMMLSETKGINVRFELIRDKNISNKQAALLSLLMDIDISDGLPSNSELSAYFRETKSSISRSINDLIRKGYLKRHETYTDIEAFELLNSSNSVNGCLFCGFNRCTLDKHHYPIRAKDGGLDTINLCPNCHRMFHEFTDYNRRVFIRKDLINGN